MITVIRTWLISVTAAAIVIAAAENLMPDGAVKKIGKLTGGLLLIVAILQPIKQLDFETMSDILTEYRIESQGSSKTLEIENQSIMKMIIEEETSAYVQNKANELGIRCNAETTCKVDESGNIYPVSMVIYGDLTQEQKAMLTRLIEGNLAIPEDSVRYERTKEK